ncbi:hypothetical protein [Poriferisphaera sp. WC338]|uniref:hypothetical protein n=1 Tax=Poriferisphaera sp. WC338 TaxID=3425129 RepID=UPI003D814CAC
MVPIIAALLFIILPILQFTFPPKLQTTQTVRVINKQIKHNRQLTFSLGKTGSFKINPIEFPHLGPLNAPTTFVKLYDYTCQHCRAQSAALLPIQEKDLDQILIILMPTPLNSNCSPLIQTTLEQHKYACELAKLSLAVYRAMPQQYEQYHHFLMQGQSPPSPEKARAFAESLIGINNLNIALKHPYIAQQLNRSTELYRMIDSPLPILFTGTHILKGFNPKIDLKSILKQYSTLQ